MWSAKFRNFENFEKCHISIKRPHSTRIIGSIRHIRIMPIERASSLIYINGDASWKFPVRMRCTVERLVTEFALFKLEESSVSIQCHSLVWLLENRVLKLSMRSMCVQDVVVLRRARFLEWEILIENSVLNVHYPGVSRTSLSLWTHQCVHDAQQEISRRVWSATRLIIFADMQSSRFPVRISLRAGCTELTLCSLVAPRMDLKWCLSALRHCHDSTGAVD